MSVENRRVSLQMQIIRDPCREIDKQRMRVFGDSGGIVGRLPDCFWVLPDPKRYVSGHHLTIECRDGGYWIRDTSRNGVFLNDSHEPVGFGHTARLQDGDRMAVGKYRVLVNVRETENRETFDLSDQDVVIDRGANPQEPESLTSSTSDGMLPSVLADEPSAEASSTERRSPTWSTNTQFLDPHIAMTEPGRVVKVDRVALQAAGLLSPPKQERLTANQFRKIKRPVIANAVGKGSTTPVPNGHLVMLTSALPGEGKTFSSVNLAFSLAKEKDLEVLLIDADVAKPNVSNVFGIKDEPGLLDALADRSLDVESLILRTDIERLSVLSAGRCESDTATELLASSRMEEVVARIAACHPRRIVVLDSPPLLLTNESQVLATLVGQIVLVVRAGFTPKPAVLEAVALISQDVPVGLVLNQSRTGAKGSYYGYGSYGYGYGYGVYGDADKSAAK